MKASLPAGLLALALTLSLTACGGTETTLTDDAAPSPSVSAPETTAPAAVTVTEGTVLLDWEGFTVTVRELTEDPIWGPELKLLVENNTQKDLGLGCDSLVVNGYMLPALLSVSVAPGKKSNESLILSADALEAAGIVTPADLALRLHVYDGDSYQTVYQAPEILLPTSASGTVDQPPMDQGQTLLDEGGVRVVARSVEEDGLLLNDVELYLENNTGRDILVSGDDISVNGFMVSSLLSCQVNDGCRAIDQLSLLSADLEENGIESIESIELTLRIRDLDAFTVLQETGPLTITLS